MVEVWDVDLVEPRNFNVDIVQEGRALYYNAKQRAVPPESGWEPAFTGTAQDQSKPKVRFRREDAWQTLWEGVENPVLDDGRRQETKTAPSEPKQPKRNQSISAVAISRGMRVRSKSGRRGDVTALTGSKKGRYVDVKFEDEMIAEPFKMSTFWRNFDIETYSEGLRRDISGASTWTQETQESALSQSDPDSLKVNLPQSFAPRPRPAPRQNKKSRRQHTKLKKQDTSFS